MRLYHQHYRQKNPRRTTTLRGDRKEIHSAFMAALQSTGSRAKNPKRAGQMIDTFNLLGELNRMIDEGQTQLIPLRDTVSARIDGYLSDEALKHSLSAALRDLSKTEVRVIREMIADLGNDVSPEEGRDIRRRAKRHPDVSRAQARVYAAEKAESEFRKSIAKGLLDDTEFLVGPKRLATMKAQQAGARAELGDDTYRPANLKLWKAIEKALEKKFPHKFVPAKLESKRKQEWELLFKMRDKDTPGSEKERIKRRLQTSIASRWKTALLKSYEKAGGEELTHAEVKLREAQRMRNLDTPFPLGPGFMGVIKSPKNSKDKGYRWDLIDVDGFTYISGTSGSKNSSSREVAIAHRVVVNLFNLGDDAGWDNIPTNDRRWLESKRPQLSTRVARILLQNINERIKISKSTAQWLVSSADLPKYKAEGEKDVAKTCKNMTLGEEMIFTGPKNAYGIHVRKGPGGKFVYFVETADGKRSQKRRTPDCNEVLRRGHLVGGAMAGAGEVTRAISNPAKIKRLQNSAIKYFRKANPKLPREAAEEGDIRELTGMVGIPYDPEDAYRYGFYTGIIRGIDTCGVQNYLKRRRIRNEFQERLLSAAMETTARVTGTRGGRFSKRKNRSKTTEEVDEINETLSSVLADVGD